MLQLCLLAVLSWLYSRERSLHAPRGSGWPRHVPAVAYPIIAGRGELLLASVLSLGARVDRLLICDNSGGAPDVACALQELRALMAAGQLPVQSLQVLTPSGAAAGAVYGVSECWNAMAAAAFGAEGAGEGAGAGAGARVGAGAGTGVGTGAAGLLSTTASAAQAAAAAAAAPWMLLLNEDVGFAEGALEQAAEDIWALHASHSLLLSHSNMPGFSNGNAFSAFVVTRAGYGALGSFDENFYPAYYEDCDYIRRARLLALPWRTVASLQVFHPVQKKVVLEPVPASYQACLAAALAKEGSAALLQRVKQRSEAMTASLKLLHYSSWDWPSDRDYYRRKWGGAPDDCGTGDFSTPFNDPLRPVSAWQLEPAMRAALLQAANKSSS